MQDFYVTIAICFLAFCITIIALKLKREEAVEFLSELVKAIVPKQE